MNRLEESMRDGITPRIEEIGLQPMALEDGKHALVLRVPRSPRRPHVVTYKNHWKFFSRSTTGKFQMNYPQVRQAFLSSGETEDKIRGFRDKRLRQVGSGETPVEIQGRARVVLHLVPFSAFDSPSPTFELDMRRSPLNEGLLQALSWGGSPRHNCDGVLATLTSTDTRLAATCSSSEQVWWKRWTTSFSTKGKKVPR
jgi:hypothetical protein